ncbi:hypothetical protein BH11PSE11_BH11PSE11_00820 [soil metagenome]
MTEIPSYWIVLAILITACVVWYATYKATVLRQQMTPPPPVPVSSQAPSIDLAPPYKMVQSRHGWMLANPNDIYLGKALLAYGECCEVEVQFLIGLLSMRPGAVVEIGTNIGTHTVPIAKALALQYRELHVFEPQPFIFQNMCANLALNGLQNVRAWPLACGGPQQESVTFARQDYLAQGNFGGVSMAAQNATEGIVVPCVRLDEILGGETVSLIKIDVEGFELFALQGAENILAKSRPVLFVENDRVDNSRALIEWLWSHGYRLWWHVSPLFNAQNFFGNPEDIYGGVSSLNMLCLPRELDLPVPALYEVVSSATHPLKKES